jgi:uncharacterized protein
MKKIARVMVCTLLLASAGASLRAQDTPAPETPASRPASRPAELALAGNWEGALDVGTKLRLGLRVKTAPLGRWTAVLDSIDQGAADIGVDTIEMDDQRAVKLRMSSIGATFSGTMAESGKAIEGTWKQGPSKLPLTFTRVGEISKLSRPQNPLKPFPYDETDAAFSYDPKGEPAASFKPEPARGDKTRITIAGTLSTPKSPGPHPAAILITGSGPQDRDELLMGHRPFLVLADHLARAGIAVLRCDDRGIGGSTGDFQAADTRDFANDARAAIAYLKTRPEIDAERIGLIGHSEGGLVAPMVAQNSKDVAFVVMLAGPGVPGRDILLEQARLISKAMGAPEDSIATQDALRARIYDVVAGTADLAECKATLRELLEDGWEDMSPAERAGAGRRETFIVSQIEAVCGAWFRFFVPYDPRPALEKMHCPVLALLGEKDLQVPAAQNAPELEKALAKGGNKDFSVRRLEGLNHLFQHAETGAPAEYGTIEETFAPEALSAISEWIGARFMAKKH